MSHEIILQPFCYPGRTREFPHDIPVVLSVGATGDTDTPELPKTHKGHGSR